MIRICFLLCLIGGSFTSVGAESATSPGMAWAKVTIPYAELSSLWETARNERTRQAQRSVTKPPVGAVVDSADYELVIGEGVATLNANYTVRSLTEKWQMIPLLGGQARLKDAETGTAGVHWQDGGYHLMFEGKGEIKSKLGFVLPPTGSWGKGMSLVPGAASMNRLKISGIPAGKTVKVEGLTPSEVKEGMAVYHLPGNGCEVKMALVDFVALEPIVPSKWTTQSEVVVSYREGRLAYACQVYGQADEGSGLSMDLLLPHNALSVTYRGADVLEGRLGKRAGGVRPLHLEWNTRDVLDRKVEVFYEVPQSPLASEWTLNAPAIAGAEDAKNLYAVVSVSGLELTGDNLNDSIQSRRLPEWMRKQIGAADFLTLEDGTQVPLQVSWLPRIQTAQAMVSRSECRTRVVADGALLIEAEYIIRHQAPLNWRLKVPKADEVLSCSANGAAVQPVKRGEDEIEFSLTATTNGETKVTLSYAAREEALDSVSGRLTLELPRTDLFIDSLQWVLTLPENYETTAVEGNVTFDTKAGQGDASRLIRLKKELVRGEHPAVEVYYQRRGVVGAD